MAIPDTILWIAGTSWDSVPGTDRRLVDELAEHFDVIWVDPPVRLPKGAIASQKIKQVQPRVWRLPIYTLPGITRPLIRRITSWILQRNIQTALRTMGRRPIATVVAFPIARFPSVNTGKRIFYVTDDWLSSAHLTGFSQHYMRKIVARNLRSADVVAAVTPVLLESLNKTASFTKGIVFPNGCPEISPRDEVRRRREIGLFGQLNERLDLEILEQLQLSGVRILVAGPRTDTDKAFGSKLSRFLESENVQWVGAVSSAELQQYLARVSVGITPYADTEFNRSSFPLKTLEYLAAGVPVVATSSPAVDWLQCDQIYGAEDTASFVGRTLELLDASWDIAEEEQRRYFAKNHSWRQRARQFSELIGHSSVGNTPSEHGKTQGTLKSVPTINEP